MMDDEMIPGITFFYPSIHLVFFGVWHNHGFYDSSITSTRFFSRVEESTLINLIIIVGQGRMKPELIDIDVLGLRHTR